MGNNPTLSHLEATYNFLCFGCQQKFLIFQGFLAGSNRSTTSWCHHWGYPNIQTTEDAGPVSLIRQNELPRSKLLGVGCSGEVGSQQTAGNEPAVIKAKGVDESLIASDRAGFAGPSDWNKFGGSRAIWEWEWAKVDR